VSEGRATLARRIEAAHLPDTVQAVIRARIDRLDSQTQEVLRLASVIGREFARTLLERMVAPKDIVGATLEALNAQDLIRQVRVLPEPEYMFKHVLTQVVVYETLLLMRRQALHELVGQAIEELYADRVEEHYESLAHHYRLSDNREKAIRYLELAGDKAKRQYVLEQTVKNYRQAIELLDGLDKTAKRMRQHIDIAIKWADLIVPSVELIGALRIATSFAEQLGDDDRLAKSASFLGQMLYYTGDFDGAVPELQRVIAMSSVLDDQDRVGSSYRVLGQLYLNTSRRAEGLECLEKARPIVRRTQNRFEESCAVGLIATEYGLTGRFEESRALFDEAVRIARAGGERSIEAWEGVWRASVLCARGTWDEAIATCDEAIELGRRIENVWAVTWSTIRKGYALFMAGDQQAGLALTGEAVQQLEGPRPLVNVADAFGRLADMLGLAGRGDDAAPYAEKALAHLRTGTGYTAETRAYRARAIASAARGDWASVDSDMQKSLVNAKTFEYRPELGVGYFRYAELLRDKGEPERAHEQLDQAVELFTALDMTWWMEQADRLRVRLSPS
jgi:tetratricopeptide (TPR) repeat protein